MKRRDILSAAAVGGISVSVAGCLRENFNHARHLEVIVDSDEIREFDDGYVVDLVGEVRTLCTFCNSPDRVEIEVLLETEGETTRTKNQTVKMDSTFQEWDESFLIDEEEISFSELQGFTVSAEHVRVWRDGEELT